MYKEFFGLSDYPFSLTPDPKYLVATPGYNELLAGLYYGIEMAKGLIVLTGEVGTGKTTALRWIIRRLDSSVLASYIFNPHLSIDEFYHHIGDSFEIKNWFNKSALFQQLGKLCEVRHRRGLRTLLIVDEGHELSDEVLEEIRLLLNFESDNAKHLQVILAGQPELRDRLKQHNLRQLKQRVALNCKMPALTSAKDVASYIRERLKIAGAINPNIFSAAAVDLIFQCSEGIPRQINNLCDNAMIAAYASNLRVIDREIIEETARDLDLLPERETLLASERVADIVATAQVLSKIGRKELLTAIEPLSGRELLEGAHTNPNGSGRGEKS